MSIKDNSSENQLNILFEYDPGLIFVHDLKGNIINMNKNLIKALGYKSKENILNEAGSIGCRMKSFEFTYQGNPEVARAYRSRKL